MSTIPPDYPSNRNTVGRAVLEALSDPPDVQLARAMVAASDDTGCQNRMILAALETVTGEQTTSLISTGRKLLATIPGDYPNNRERVARALLQRLRSQYAAEQGRIDRTLQSGSSSEINSLLEELANSRSTVQEVEDLARAVAGRENQTGIEERGSVVVIGGTRVRVKK